MLAQAQSWLAKGTEASPNVGQEFIHDSPKRERATRRRMQALVGLLAVGIVAGLVGWRPYVLTTQAERALKPKISFPGCPNGCPEMIVIPAGDFMMGSPKEETGRYEDEGPRHKVLIAKPFAVSKFEVTFEEWDACVAIGGCVQVSDSGMGRGTQPVTDVGWEDVQQYVAWLSKQTGQIYRLLSEAEWEYAARAGTDTAYSWGDKIGRGNANCNNCGSPWDDRQSAPVGSFAANKFGLHDMHGNVWEWCRIATRTTTRGRLRMVQRG